MAKELKFMFDRSFDDPVENVFDATAAKPLSNIFKAVETLIDQQTNAPELFEKRAQREVAAAQTEKVSLMTHDFTPPDAIIKEPPAPSFSQEQLDEAVAKAVEEAKKQAFEEGRNAGYQQGIKEGYDMGAAEKEQAVRDEMSAALETRKTQALETIADKLTHAAEQCAADEKALFDNVLSVCGAVYKKALPALLEKHGAAEISALIKNTLPSLKEESKITLRLSEDMANALKDTLGKTVAATGFSGKIAVVKDDSLQAGDCCIEWKNGGVERKIKDITGQTDALLNAYASSPEQKTPEQENVNGGE